MASIVFIHTLEQNEGEKWLTRLSKLLPHESVFLPEKMTAEQREEVDIAIVANPDVEELARFPNLVWVQSLWAGVEKMTGSLKTLNATRKGPEIKLVRLIDPQLAQTMGEAVLAWTLYLHRNMPEYRQNQIEKHWQPFACPSAHEVRVSILGTGELGINAMQKLVAQGYQVNGWSRSKKTLNNVAHFHGEDGLMAMLQQTDILVCLLPLTPQTENLLNKQTFFHLPQGAKFINFARGKIANYTDLVTVLDEEHLSHAVLDVFEEEPLPTSSPLWGHSKITVLPHISATTNLDSASRIVAENILNYRHNGILPESVDLERGY